jgi:hypothetical protein
VRSDPPTIIAIVDGRREDPQAFEPSGEGPASCYRGAMAWLRWGSVCLTVALASCSSDDSGGDGSASGGTLMDDLPPSTNCPGGSDTGGCQEDGGASASASAGGSGSCQSAADCMVGEGCLAPFDGEIGEFVCRPGCIGMMDEDWWCADASACCDPSATCTMRGYCVPSEDDSDGSSSNGSSSGEASSDEGTAGDSDGSSAGSEGDASTGGSSGTG